ncbi:hypothetical protein [Streptomyces profundus]|uniref:hypothetical protein n=1 Tax=Streptomyces profundus TaxID=2867410 RepID=UPI001D16AD22|nr:hypothetical protein [Streptomyces sp. MA3_2.13]UED83984.1 hypothetical protein K4G22_06980 [Streptomyces sp. MA3_2.13]
MPTDDIAITEGEEPRHAAPRRSLLRRLHMPVGKAIALAAMPSAALLGMGFTSPLAKAEPQPENPFRPGACVEMPDEPAEPEEPEEAAEADEPDAADDEAEDDPADDDPADGAPEESADEGADEPADDGAGADESAQDPPPGETPDEPGTGQDEAPPPADGVAPGAPDDEDATQPPDEAAPGWDPWDPLGLGRGLEELGEGILDLLTPGERAEWERARRDALEREELAPPEETPEETPEQAAERPESEQAAEEQTVAREPEPEPTVPADPEPGRPEEVDEPARPAADSTDQQQEPETADGEGDEEADDEGLEPFPCPEERQVPGEDEATALTLPDEPWYLDASYLTLRGLSYHGVVNVTTANGNVKQVLKFTADKLDIGDLHQIVDAPGNVRYHVATDPGSNSTFRDGTVTMYTERLEGNLFGVIPVVFDPEHQPPIDLPIAHFTDVFVTQAGQFGGTLNMAGMRIYTTGDGPTVR